MLTQREWGQCTMNVEELMRSVFVAAYRVVGYATKLGCRKSLVLNKAR